MNENMQTSSCGYGCDNGCGDYNNGAGYNNCGGCGGFGGGWIWWLIILFVLFFIFFCGFGFGC